MAKRSPGSSSFWTQPLQRTIDAMTRATVRAGTQALEQGVRLAQAQARTLSGPGDWIAGFATGPAGMRRYRLFRPPGVRFGERRPLLAMLHGCGQDAETFALSTRMNRVAAREGFLVLYPEQDRRANPQGCWNWYGTRSGQAHGEAATLMAAIDQVCRLYPVDPGRVAIAGLSAGASMGAFLATRYPERFRAVAMHSGIPPGAAHSSASALWAMGGHRTPTVWAPAVAWPPLLVIHGSADRVVSANNGEAAASLWAEAAGARPAASRRVRRGTRHETIVTDFKAGRRTVATLCQVDGMGHCWSGGDARQAFSDARGPDASRMIWAFAARQFAAASRGAYRAA